MQTFPLVHASMMQCVKKTIMTEGVIKGLYAGTVPALVCNIAENSILFLSYGICQKILMKFNNDRDLKELSALNNACAGSMASFVASLAICPTELVKCKLQALYETKKGISPQIGPVNLVKTILKQEGIQGFYRGFVPTIAREMPGYFFFFGGYEGIFSYDQ